MVVFILCLVGHTSTRAFNYTSNFADKESGQPSCKLQFGRQFWFETRLTQNASRLVVVRDAKAWPGTQAKLARRTELASNVGKRRASVLANARNSGQADNDNERQHNRVFNSSWSVFAIQKALQLQGEILHLDNPPTGFSVVPSINMKTQSHR